MQEEDIIKWQQQLAENGDQRALEKLYLLFYDRLYRFACSLVGQAEIAEEIVEDVFVKLWQKRSTAREIINLRIYLYVAVKNKSLNYLDWKSRDIISYFETYPEDIHVSSDTPDHLLMTKEIALRINNAVEALPPKCKLIFKLVREEGLKYKDVAEILGISPRTVDTQMTIALKKIGGAIALKTSGSIY